MMPAIKVIFVLPDLGGGGAERVTLSLLRNLDRSQFQPVLYLFQKDGVYWDEIPSDVPVFWASQPGQRMRNNLPTILAELIHEMPETSLIVGCLELDSTYFAYACGRLFRKPVIGWVHTLLEPYLSGVPDRHRRLSRQVYPGLDKIVCPSESAARSTLQAVGLPLKQIEVIENPIDLELVQKLAGEELPEWAEKIYIRPVLVAVGRLEVRKGFEVLLKSFAAACRQGLTCNLLILGEGSLRSSLERLADTENISKYVFMPGFQANPYPLIRRAAGLVHPTHLEGFGMVLIEAMALGVPVIAARDLAMEYGLSAPEVILQSGRYGLIVPSDDIIALRDVILRFFSDEAKRRTMATEAQIRAKDFSVDRIVEKWQNLLHRVVPSKLI